MVHEVKNGKRTRKSFSKIREVLKMPNFIEVQKDSYKRFLKEGLAEVLKDISPITDYSENLVLESVSYSSHAPRLGITVVENRSLPTLSLLFT